MEEIIRKHIEGLTEQRMLIFKDLYRIEVNDTGYFNKKQVLDEQINIIDLRIDSLLDRLNK